VTFVSVLYHLTVFSGSDVNGNFKSLGTCGFGLDIVLTLQCLIRS